jgi:hypothetical protein
MSLTIVGWNLTLTETCGFCYETEKKTVMVTDDDCDYFPCCESCLKKVDVKRDLIDEKFKEMGL